MTDPIPQPGRSHVLAWILVAISGGCLAVAAAAIAMVAQPGPLAAAKNEASDACDQALAYGYSEVTEASIIEETIFTSVNWRDYHRKIEAFGYGGHTSVDDLSADQIAETDADFTVLRGEGEETVWVVWEIEGDDLWQCVATLRDGEVLGQPVIGSPPRE